LINTLPDGKMKKVLISLEGLKDIITDNLPDQWDLKLIEEAIVAEKKR